MIAFWTRPSVNCAVWTHLFEEEKKWDVRAGGKKEENFLPSPALLFLPSIFIFDPHTSLWRAIKITSFIFCM